MLAVAALDSLVDTVVLKIDKPRILARAEKRMDLLKAGATTNQLNYVKLVAEKTGVRRIDKKLDNTSQLWTYHNFYANICSMSESRFAKPLKATRLGLLCAATSIAACAESEPVPMPITDQAEEISRVEYGYEDPRITNVIRDFGDIVFTICNVELDQASVAIQDGDINAHSVVVCFPKDGEPYSADGVG